MENRAAPDTPETDAIVPSASFIRETRLFDMSYYLPLLDHARSLELRLREETAWRELTNRAYESEKRRAEEAERRLLNEYICSCGMRVTPHHCNNSGEF